MSDIEVYREAVRLLEEARDVVEKLNGKTLYENGEKMIESWERRREFYEKVVQALNVKSRIQMMCESYKDMRG